MIAEDHAFEEHDEDDGVHSPLDDLQPKQQEAIVALLREPTVGRAASSIGVGERTLFRWLDDPAFGKVYRKARRDAYGQAIALTQHFAPLAVNTLAQVMADKNAPFHARVSAAGAVLKFGRDGIELDDLAARVETLEQTVKEDDTKNQHRR